MNRDTEISSVPVSCREPLDYLVRNHNIVDETSVLFACPYTPNEEVRSGTWATVRYARKTGHRVILILPDGSTQDIRSQNPAKVRPSLF